MILYYHLPVSNLWIWDSTVHTPRMKGNIPYRFRYWSSRFISLENVTSKSITVWVFRNEAHVMRILREEAAEWNILQRVEVVQVWSIVSLQNDKIIPLEWIPHTFTITRSTARKIIHFLGWFTIIKFQEKNTVAKVTLPVPIFLASDASQWYFIIKWRENA